MRSQNASQTRWGVPQQAPALSRAEPDPLARRVQHQDPEALLGVVPAAHEQGQVAGDSEQREVAGEEHDAEEDHHRRRGRNAREAVAQGEGRGRAERLACEAAVEELVGVGDMRVGQHEGERERGAGERGARGVVPRIEGGERRDHEQAAPAEGEEVDPAAVHVAPARGASARSGPPGTRDARDGRAGAQGQVDSHARVRHRQEILRRGRLGVFRPARPADCPGRGRVPRGGGRCLR